TAYALRAAQTLRGIDAVSEALRELERTRALLALVAQATAQLSLQHTLATAVEHVAALVAADRVAVYLREGERLQPTASRSLAGPHGVVAEKLLELALGTQRGRGLVVVQDFERDEALASVSDAAGEAG